MCVSPPQPELYGPYAQALVWRILVGLLRRHGKRAPLTLTETHPGGGMYHVIGLTNRETFQSWIGFNLHGSSIRFHCPDGALPEPCEAIDVQRGSDLGRYPAIVVGQSLERCVDCFTEVMRLDDRPADPLPMTPELLSWTVLSQVLSRTAMRSHPVCVESGWLDSSGMVGSYQNAWLAPFLSHPPYGSQLLNPDPSAPKDWTVAAKESMDHWRLGLGASNGHLGILAESPQRVLHIPSARLYRMDGSLERELVKDWKKGRKIRELAWFVERSLA